jgi:predicted tellurium resistance membrane protein TerC
VVLAMLVRFPMLVWGGSAILGWVAGEIMIKDQALTWWFAPETLAGKHYITAALGAAIVVLVANVLVRRHRRRVERELL